MSSAALKVGTVSFQAKLKALRLFSGTLLPSHLDGQPCAGHGEAQESELSKLESSG